MNDVRRVLVKNSLLLTVLLSNNVGFLGVMLLRSVGYSSFVSAEVLAATQRVIPFHLLFALLAGPLAIVLYERPIREALDRLHRGEAVAPALLERARRRLLNHPLFSIADSLLIWGTAAVLFPWILARGGAPRSAVAAAAFLSLSVGVVTSVVAFFALELVLRALLVPRLFPGGGLSATRGAARLRVSTRLLALFVGATALPVGLVHFQSWLSTSVLAGRDPAVALADLQKGILLGGIVSLLGGGVLFVLVSSYLARSIGRLTAALEPIREGRFDARVEVVTNDEIGYAGDVVNEMAAGLAERERIREVFGRYVSKEVRDVVLSGRVPLDGQTMEVTVLFADLRGFTPLSEATRPAEMVRILNDYFQEMTAAVEENGGLVLQYVGDEVMAVFGAPVPCPDHAARAVRAALAMRRRLCEVNRALAERGEGPLENGIGIHSGEVVAANIGSVERHSYNLVGDTVNTASRLQGLNKELGTKVILSGETRARLGGALPPVPLVPLPPARVKGKSRELEVYTLELAEGA